MTDILIRDLPEDVVAGIDARAARAGLSRNEYLRRTLAREATPPAAVTASDLSRFTERFADLGDEQVMRNAWQ